MVCRTPQNGPNTCRHYHISGKNRSGYLSDLRLEEGYDGMGKHGSIQTRLSRSRTSCFRHGSIATDMAWHVYVCIFICIGSMLWSSAYPHRMMITALSNGEIRVRKVSTGMRSTQHAPSSASSRPCSSLSAPGAGAPVDGESWRKG